MTTTFLEEKGIVCAECLGQEFGFDEYKGTICVRCESTKRKLKTNDLLLREIFIKFGDKDGNKNY